MLMVSYQWGYPAMQTVVRDATQKSGAGDAGGLCICSEVDPTDGVRSAEFRRVLFHQGELLLFVLLDGSAEFFEP